VLFSRACLPGLPGVPKAGRRIGLPFCYGDVNKFGLGANSAKRLWTLVQKQTNINDILEKETALALIHFRKLPELLRRAKFPNMDAERTGRPEFIVIIGPAGLGYVR